MSKKEPGIEEILGDIRDIIGKDGSQKFPLAALSNKRDFTSGSDRNLYLKFLLVLFFGFGMGNVYYYHFILPRDIQAAKLKFEHELLMKQISGKPDIKTRREIPDLINSPLFGTPDLFDKSAVVAQKESIKGHNMNEVLLKKFPDLSESDLNDMNARLANIHDVQFGLYNPNLEILLQMGIMTISKMPDLYRISVFIGPMENGQEMIIDIERNSDRSPTIMMFSDVGEAPPDVGPDE